MSLMHHEAALWRHLVQNPQTEHILFSHFLTLFSQFHAHSLLISRPYSPVSVSAVQAGSQDGWVPTAPGFD